MNFFLYVKLNTCLILSFYSVIYNVHTFVHVGVNENIGKERGTLGSYEDASDLSKNGSYTLDN
jgi:hypothetical protein